MALGAARLAQWAASLAARRWRSVLLVAMCVAITTIALRGAHYSEWREIAYYRVDPFPVLPHRLSTHSDAASPPHGPSFRPPGPPPAAAPPTCPGPHGRRIPRAPLALHPTPDTHPIPIVGDGEAIGIDSSHCLTYRARYAMYTDDALGITYRRAIVDGELQRMRDRARRRAQAQKIKAAHAAAASTAPPPTATGVNAFAAADADAAAAAALADDPSIPPDPDAGPDLDPNDPDYIDPLLGRTKPTDVPPWEWENRLRADVWEANDAAELLGPSSFPDWRALLDRCYTQRQDERGGKTDPFVPGGNAGDTKSKYRTTKETKRSVIVLRAYEGYVWREDDILNLRAMITELGLNNPLTPYDVRILVEVKGPHLAPFTSEWDRLQVLRSSVPREFWGLVELWTETELCALYPGLPGKFKNHMIAQASYRSCLMALQKLWLDHQEYDFVWNWEMDVRYIGNYLDFMEGVEEFGRREPLHKGMDKYKAWFVRNVTESEENWADDPTLTEGRGSEADLLTLAPIFDPIGSGWFWEYDIQNYPGGEATPRRASIGTNMRMSRALMEAMNVVNSEAKKSTHCEAWPTTLTLHSQLPISDNHSFGPEAGYTHNLPIPFKGVFAPVPIFFRHFWDPHVLASKINKQDVYHKTNERLLRDASQYVYFLSPFEHRPDNSPSSYYDGAHSREIYMGWRNSARQGKAEVCRTPTFLHPIKRIE